VSTTELSAETRARILGTAWQLVRDRGAGAVTVKEVAAAAGVSRQLIYFHYQNRAGLLLAMARHQDRSSGFQREVAATRALDPVPGFEALLRAWCGYMAEILPVARALEAAYITGDEGGDAWRDRMTELREAFRLALERIAAEGRLAPAWTGETAADWAWARVQPGSWAALVGMRGWDRRDYTERMVDSLLAELVTAPGQLPISAGRTATASCGSRVRSGPGPGRPRGRRGDGGSPRPGRAGRRCSPGTPPPGPGRG
jgi:AcrR family transcriptional regulator